MSRVHGSGFRIQGKVFRGQCPGFRIQGSGSTAGLLMPLQYGGNQGLEFRVSGFGFRVGSLEIDDTHRLAVLQ